MYMSFFCLFIFMGVKLVL